jgi:uncharacterized damage-inducible protein DinB
MNETLQILSHTPAKLETMLDQLESDNKLDAPRAAGKWTPRQILAHLCDVESVQRVRVMAMLSEHQSVMLGFNADVWAAAGEYAKRDARVSVAALTALRTSNLELWGALTAEQLERRGTHPIRGEFSLAEWLGFVARHDLNHLDQLELSLS